MLGLGARRGLPTPPQRDGPARAGPLHEVGRSGRRALRSVSLITAGPRKPPGGAALWAGSLALAGWLAGLWLLAANGSDVGYYSNTYLAS